MVNLINVALWLSSFHMFLSSMQHPWNVASFLFAAILTRGNL